MRILFVSDLHYLPQHRGGTQSLIHELSLELAARGHEPMVLAPLHPSGVIGLRNRGLMKMSGRPTVRDDFLGYPVFRRWRVSGQLDEPIAMIRPDAAIVMPMAAVRVARELVRLGVPTTVYFQDVESQQLCGDPSQLDHVCFASNSQFTAKRYLEQFGVSSVVIPPLIKSERYKAERDPRHVTMINPHPLKGGDIALAIAEACPDIPFRLISCWVLPDRFKNTLVDRVRRLGNVTLQRPTSNMRKVYAQTRILLAPSRWDEAWGRVASEAQVNGIPVVASNRGGLIESVGPGGVLLDPDGPIEPWIEAVRRLWSDEKHYAELSAAALAYASRPEITPSRIVDQLLAVVGRSLHSRADGERRRQKTAPATSAAAI
jgi:glycosyltransferase involved in cell wall biosynthesis